MHGSIHTLAKLFVWPPRDVFKFEVGRAVASLTAPGGQEFHFPHFSSNFDQFFLFFLKLYLFSSSFWPSGWASRPPGKALATPLEVGLLFDIVIEYQHKN